MGGVAICHIYERYLSVGRKHVRAKKAERDNEISDIMPNLRRKIRCWKENNNSTLPSLRSSRDPPGYREAKNPSESPR